MFDIHSHILPGVDDGAKNIEKSLALLEQMKLQGITDVIATPHFYANSDNYEDYWVRVRNAYNELQSAVLGKELPRVYLGSEVLFFNYIGSCESIHEFCLNKSNYLLLEFSDRYIASEVFENIRNLRNNFGITPIIAHLERYYRASGYKKLLEFIKSENLPVQINASSLFEKHYGKAAEKLLKQGFVNFIATDSHSPVSRPPMMDKAIACIEEKFGKECSERLITNSDLLLEEITSGRS